MRMYHKIQYSITVLHALNLALNFPAKNPITAGAAKNTTRKPSAARTASTRPKDPGATQTAGYDDVAAEDETATPSAGFADSPAVGASAGDENSTAGHCAS